MHYLYIAYPLLLFLLVAMPLVIPGDPWQIYLFTCPLSVPILGHALYMLTRFAWTPRESNKQA